ncbi:MAG: Trm112 family protein [Planctomycetota bacterium]
MIDPELLAILVCPDTRQPLSLAGEELVARVNAAIERSGVATVGGAAVREALEEGLVRADGRVIYPVRQSIPVLLIEEGIPVPGA